MMTQRKRFQLKENNIYMFVFVFASIVFVSIAFVSKDFIWRKTCTWVWICLCILHENVFLITFVFCICTNDNCMYEKQNYVFMSVRGPIVFMISVRLLLEFSAVFSVRTRHTYTNKHFHTLLTLHDYLPKSTKCTLEEPVFLLQLFSRTACACSCTGRIRSRIWPWISKYCGQFRLGHVNIG